MIKWIVIGIIILIGLMDYALLIACSHLEDEEMYKYEEWLRSEKNMEKDRCYGCFGASFGDCDRCQEEQEDVIYREDVIQALTESDIRGHEYAALMRRIKEIPSAGRSRR